MNIKSILLTTLTLSLTALAFSQEMELAADKQRLFSDDAKLEIIKQKNEKLIHYYADTHDKRVNKESIDDHHDYYILSQQGARYDTKTVVKNGNGKDLYLRAPGTQETHKHTVQDLDGGTNELHQYLRANNRYAYDSVSEFKQWPR